MKEDGRYDLKTKNKYINFQIAIVMKEIKNLSAMVSLFQKENTGGALEKRKSVKIQNSDNQTKGSGVVYERKPDDSEASKNQSSILRSLGAYIKDIGDQLLSMKKTETPQMEHFGNKNISLKESGTRLKKIVPTKKENIKSLPRSSTRKNVSYVEKEESNEIETFIDKSSQLAVVTISQISQPFLANIVQLGNNNATVIDTEEDSDGIQNMYTVPLSRIEIIIESGRVAYQRRKYIVGEAVYALYPGTNCFYRAIISKLGRPEKSDYRYAVLFQGETAKQYVNSRFILPTQIFKNKR
eukprot:GHVP01023625.1.p1 GENE.GHVP01023625.1~~GHVP01023625.1.p1  ORF type:complete len:297 (+),score=54.67 GHVP01023625.1:15-905(+)